MPLAKLYDTEPVPQNDQVEAINNSIGLTIYLGSHKNTAEAKLVAPFVAEADIVAPETAGWNSDRLRAANIFTATKQQKVAMSTADVQDGYQYWKGLSHNYTKTLFGMMKDRGKRIHFIDISDDHPSYIPLRETGNGYFRPSLMSTVTNKDFTDAISTYKSVFHEYAVPHIRQRELTIRHNLFNLLLDNSSEQRNRKTSILTTLGSAHETTANWLVSTGIKPQVKYAEPTYFDAHTVAAQQAMDGNKITDNLAAGSMLSGIFSAAAKHYAPSIKSRLSKASVIQILIHQFGKAFTFDDMALIWDANDANRSNVFDKLRQERIGNLNQCINNTLKMENNASVV